MSEYIGLGQAVLASTDTVSLAICTRCGALVANVPNGISIHDDFHKNLADLASKTSAGFSKIAMSYKDGYGG